jgi:hypothetical protein
MSTKPNDMPLQTKASVASDLQHLGVRGGQLLMVHSSLNCIGYVLGGAQAVVRALIEVLGPSGTLTMPAFSPDVSDPATWGDRPFGGDHPELAQDAERIARSISGLNGVSGVVGPRRDVT